uniref:Uncharacterized protein n=1 Tax=Erpetoichthys calabaricus TaxID=27687 RepID=A0A8C4RF89_ERPCA
GALIINNPKDELTCFMCLQIYSYPVSLSCTHSFCLKCIQDHFKYRDDTEKYSCPECYAKFEEKPRLLKNTDLSEQVLHLVYLQSHVLVHREMLKLFCRDHRTCICTLCSLVGEHKQHMVCTVEEAKMEAEVRGRILKYKTHFFFISGMLLFSIITFRSQSQSLFSSFFHLFSSPHLPGKHCPSSIWGRESNSFFIQDPSVLPVLGHISLEVVLGQAEVSEIREHKCLQNPLVSPMESNKPAPWPHNSKHALQVSICVQRPSDVRVLYPTLPISWQRQDVSCLFFLLDVNRTIVRYTDETLKAPYGPKRFDDTLYVMGSEGFNFGRHYWEVITRSKTDWEIGLAYASLPRKGKTWLGRNNISWSLECNGDRCMVWHNNISIRVSINYKLERVGVYLDYTGGTIAFYDAEKISLLHSFHNKFTEAIYPVLNPCNSKGGNFAPLTVLQLKGLL